MLVKTMLLISKALVSSSGCRAKKQHGQTEEMAKMQIRSSHSGICANDAQVLHLLVFLPGSHGGR